MDAFRAGFNQVFPLEKLAPFSPFEVKSMLCGDQSPVFTRDDIVRFTEPKLGYTRESPAFLKFVNVLVNFTDAERKAFLQFTTGCSSLPPGKVYFIQDLPFQFCLFLLSYSCLPNRRRGTLINFSAIFQPLCSYSIPYVY